MAQLFPRFDHAVVFSREIDLYWINDVHATVALVLQTGQHGSQSFITCKVTGLNPNTSYPFTIENSASGSNGSVSVTEKTHNSSAQSYLVQAEIGAQGSFDLLVPKQTFIAHYTHPDNTILEGPWHFVDTLTLTGGTQTTGSTLSFIQSFQTPGEFEAIARVRPQHDTDFLVSYQFKPATGHHDPIPVISDQGHVDQVSGAPALAQTDQGTFQLAVPRAGAISTYVHNSDTVQGNWSTGPTLNPPGNSQVAATLLAQTDGQGAFVMLARVTPADGSGDTLATYQLAGPGQDWQGPFSVTANGAPITQVSGRPTLIQSNNGPQARFELLVPINGQLQHYTHTPESVAGDWSFVATLQPAKNDPQIKAASVSLVQDDTGNLDAVARVAPPQGNNFFVAYQFNPNTGWSASSNLVDDKGNVITAGGGED